MFIEIDEAKLLNANTRSPKDFEGINACLGISMNNSALKGPLLAAAFDLFKDLKVANIYAVTGGDLMRHSMTAEKKIILQIQFIAELLQSLMPHSKLEQDISKARSILNKILLTPNSIEYKILGFFIEQIDKQASTSLTEKRVNDALATIASSYVEHIIPVLFQQETLAQIKTLNDPDAWSKLRVAAINIGEQWCKEEEQTIKKAQEGMDGQICVERWNVHSLTPDFEKFIKAMFQKYETGAEFCTKNFSPEELCTQLIEKYSDSPELMRNLGSYPERNLSVDSSSEKEANEENATAIGIQTAKTKIEQIKQALEIPNFRKHFYKLIQTRLKAEQDFPFDETKAAAEAKQNHVSLPEGITHFDLYSFAKVIVREYKTGKAFHASVAQVALNHLLKHSRRKVKELSHFLDTKVFSFNGAQPNLNTASAAEPLLTEQLKKIFTSNQTLTANALQTLSSTIVEPLIQHTQFLCDYLELPTNSPLRPQLSNKTTIALEEFSRLTKQCKVLMVLFNDLKAKKYTSTIQKLRNEHPSQSLLNDIDYVLQTGTAREPKKKMFFTEIVPTDRLGEQEKAHLRKAREISENILKNTSEARASFEKVQTIYQLLLSLTPTVKAYSFKDLLKFIETYVAPAQKDSFMELVLTHILSGTKSKASTLVTILMAGKKALTPFELNQTLLGLSFGLSNEQAMAYYEKLSPAFFGKDDDLFTFLFKIAFADSNKLQRFKELFSNEYSILPKSAAHFSEVFSNNYPTIEFLRKKLLSICPSLLPCLLLLENLKKNNSQYVIRIYLNLLLEPESFLKSIVGELSNVIYLHLNNFFEGSGVSLNKDDHVSKQYSLGELEGLFAKDPIAQILFESSKQYIIEECGGFLSIAKALKLTVFAYPHHIIGALEIARSTVLLDADGEFFCAREKDLLEGHAYTFTKKKIEVSENSSSDSNKTTPRDDEPGSSHAKTASNSPTRSTLSAEMVPSPVNKVSPLKTPLTGEGIAESLVLPPSTVGMIASNPYGLFNGHHMNDGRTTPPEDIITDISELEEIKRKMSLARPEEYKELLNKVQRSKEYYAKERVKANRAQQEAKKASTYTGTLVGELAVLEVDLISNLEFLDNITTSEKKKA